MGFSARIKQIRESKNMSDDQLAQKASIERERLEQLETDTEPTVSEAAQLAEAFGMRIEELFSQDSQKPQDPQDEKASGNELFAGVDKDFRKTPQPREKQSAAKTEKGDTAPAPSQLHSSLDSLIQKLVDDKTRQEAYLEQTSKLTTPTSLSEALNFHEVALNVIVDLCGEMHERIGSVSDQATSEKSIDAKAQSIAEHVRGERDTQKSDGEQIQRSLKIIARCLGNDFPQLNDEDKAVLQALQN